MKPVVTPVTVDLCYCPDVDPTAGAI